MTNCHRKSLNPWGNRASDPWPSTLLRANLEAFRVNRMSILLSVFLYLYIVVLFCCILFWSIFVDSSGYKSKARDERWVETQVLINILSVANKFPTLLSILRPFVHVLEYSIIVSGYNSYTLVQIGIVICRGRKLHCSSIGIKMKIEIIMIKRKRETGMKNQRTRKSSKIPCKWIITT